MLLTLFVAGWAQYPRLRNIPVSDFDGGLQTWSIGEGPLGRMLFGNNQALLMYDGDSWEKLFVPNYTTVRAVYYDKRTERIYVGASDEMGYFATDEQQQAFTYHSLTHLLPKQHRMFGEIWNIFRRGNEIVFQSKNALFVMSNDRDMMGVYGNGQRIEYATFVSGKTLTAGKEGIGVLHIGGGITPLAGTEVMRGKVVRTILPYKNLILFVTSDAGVWAYDGTTTQPYTMTITPYLIEKQVFCADIDEDNIVFGTVRGGLVVYNLKTHEDKYCNMLTGLQNNTVLSVMYDKNRNVWAGLDNGISYVLKESSMLTLLGMNSQIGTGYTASIFGGNLYMGTNQGLFITPYPIKSSPVPTIPQLLAGMTGQVWTLDSIGGMLLCGTDHGAFVVRGQAATPIIGMEGTWKFCALPQHPDLVLACDYSGLVVLERSGATLTMRNRVTGTDLVSGNILTDADGSIWISHWQKGIYHLWLNDNLTTIARQEYFHKDKALLMDEGNLLFRIGGRIYVSCVDGLYRYDKAQRTLVRDETMSKVFDEYGVALTIWETPDGDLWAYKPKYLAHAIKQKNGTYKKEKYLNSATAAELSFGIGLAAYTGNNQIICSGKKGFFMLNGAFDDHSKHSPTFISSIVSTTKGDSTLYVNAIGHKEPVEVEIPHSLNSLRIEFAQPEFRAEGAVVYTCYMEGYDKEWSSEQTSTSKEYTQLARGRYTFHVKAVNQISGIADEATIEIRVLPAWYQTWWARIIWLIMIGAAGYYTYIYIKRRAIRKERLRQQEKERRMKEQEVRFSLEQSEKEKELMALRNQQMEYDMKHKSSELADSTMNLVRKNDLLQLLDENIQQLGESVRRDESKLKLLKRINDIRHDIQANLNDDANWGKFEENFNLVYDNFMQKLSAQFPDLKKNDRKLCAYLRMGLSSKEMASLMNTSVRSIETARYRLRKKLDLDNGANLTDFIQGL